MDYFPPCYCPHDHGELHKTFLPMTLSEAEGVCLHAECSICDYHATEWRPHFEPSVLSCSTRDIDWDAPPFKAAAPHKVKPRRKAKEVDTAVQGALI